MSFPIRFSHVAALLCVACASACSGARSADKAPAAHPQAPPPTVYVTKVVRRDLPLFIEAVASIDGYVNAEIRARVRGFLKSQEYKDGSFVKAGQLLFTIDPSEYKAALASAQAAITRGRAAQWRTKTQLERDQQLFKTGAASKQDLDNAEAALADANGQVQAAEAQREQAELNLSYTRVHSPINGIAGVAQVRVGNLVGQDQPTLLTTVSQVEPIRVNFPLSEVDYVENPERFREISAGRDLRWARQQFALLAGGGEGQQGEPRGIALVLADGTTYPQRGIVVSANRQIDPSTGTIQMQALFPNPDLFLRPGQYGRVRIPRHRAGQAQLVVPDKALISVQGTYSLAVVDPNDIVHLQRVETGPSAQGMRVIERGVQEGDTIVVEGVQLAQDGAKVTPKPVAAEPEPGVNQRAPPQAAPLGKP